MRITGRRRGAPEALLAIAVATLPWLAATAGAGDSDLPARPDGTGNWITDDAGILEHGDRDEINAISRTLLRDRQVPIVVVTVASTGGPSVGRYARTIFDTWGVGSPQHNYGILLLVALEDRRARIELGADWGHSADGDAQRIMDTLIVPRFKDGEYSLGILEGVRGLNALARGEAVPSPARPAWWWPTWLGLAAVFIAAVASIMRSGNDGWGGQLGHAVIGVVLGAVFSFAERSRDGDGWDGDWGGGSFGGGSSGGGGASGSW